MRTSAPRSWYVRFPFGAEAPLANWMTKPKLALRPGVRAHDQRRDRNQITERREQGIAFDLAATVTLPGVDGAPPMHGPPGAGAISHGV